MAAISGRSRQTPFIGQARPIWVTSDAAEPRDGRFTQP